MLLLVGLVRLLLLSLLWSSLSYCCGEYQKSAECMKAATPSHIPWPGQRLRNRTQQPPTAPFGEAVPTK